MFHNRSRLNHRLLTMAATKGLLFHVCSFVLLHKSTDTAVGGVKFYWVFENVSFQTEWLFTSHIKLWITFLFCSEGDSWLVTAESLALFTATSNNCTMLRAYTMASPSFMANHFSLRTKMQVTVHHIIFKLNVIFLINYSCNMNEFKVWQGHVDVQIFIHLHVPLLWKCKPSAPISTSKDTLSSCSIIQRYRGSDLPVSLNSRDHVIF